MNRLGEVSDLTLEITRTLARFAAADLADRPQSFVSQFLKWQLFYDGVFNLSELYIFVVETIDWLGSQERDLTSNQSVSIHLMHLL